MFWHSRTTQVLKLYLKDIRLEYNMQDIYLAA